MALYRHFQDKDEILDALAERLLADTRLPESDERPWHDQLADLLAALLAAVRPHPHTAGLVLNRILASEPGLTLADRTLGLLSDAGLSTQQAAETASQVLCSLITLVITEPGRVSGADPDAQDDAIRAKKASLLALPSRRYPHVVAAADALSACASEEVYLARGISLIVAGVRGVHASQGQTPN